MISYFNAEQKVAKRMAQNPTIPAEAFGTLVAEEFFGKSQQIQLNPVYPNVSGKVEKMDLGTEPEDWDLLNDGMQEVEVSE